MAEIIKDCMEPIMPIFMRTAQFREKLDSLSCPQSAVRDDKVVSDSSNSLSSRI